MIHKNKNLVFSSVGNYSNHHHWLKGKRNFDLYLINYSNKNSEYKNDADYYLERKGSKFQNFHYLFKNQRSILDQYDQFLLLDDDIIISGANISKLFDIHKKYDLFISQPAFDAKSKISHPITVVKPRYLLRYTNFVELGCPLFNKNSIYKFMKIYDPILVGYGIDQWFINVIGVHKNKIAIIDDITCTNPYTFLKQNVREIDKLQDQATRIKIWHDIQKKYTLQEYQKERIVFEYIKKPIIKIVKACIFYYWNSIIGTIYKIINKLT